MYIHFTAEQRERARSMDIAALLESQGETLIRRGSEYEWKDGSQKVTIRGNLWYHQYDQEGGDTVKFVMRFMGKSYPEAVDYLLGGSAGSLVASPPIEKKRDVGKFVPPEKNGDMRRAWAYLQIKRGIDKDILNAFVKKNMIYESANYHNAVFMGYDKEGNPKHANLRGTGTGKSYKGNAPNSSPEYSFHWHGTGEKLFVFEAPIDMLSFLSMHKNEGGKHSYAACCGVGERVVFQMLQDNPSIKKVCLCLDNDEAGQTANKRIADKLHMKGMQTEILVPVHKDWNEDLLNPSGSEGMEEVTPCRELQLS